MLRDLTDKVAWVTGAGTGIGEGGAVALAQAGMHVVLSDVVKISCNRWRNVARVEQRLKSWMLLTTLL